MTDSSASHLQFWTLYLSRFAGGFGSISLIILFPKLAADLGIEGVGAGLFYTVYTLAQTVMVVPLAWAGDRYDKRLVLLGTLGVGVATYGAFAFAVTEPQLLAVRAAQGIVFTGMGLMTLGLVGELATHGTRANRIGRANAAAFAASIVGGLSAGFLYDYFGGAREVFLIISGLYVLTFGATALLLSADDTRIEGFPFSDLAVNRRILTLTSFRAQYAVAVTLVRNWIPFFAGYAAINGGLAYPAFAVAVITVSEKFTNMIFQPFTGRLSDSAGRALFVFAGGGAYGVVALAVPFTPRIGAALGLPSSFPVVGAVSAAFVPLVLLNCGLGIADSFREPASMALFADEGSDGDGVASSFGIRELVWRPGSVVAPVVGGWLMANVGMDSVFYLGGGFAVLGAVTFLGVLWRFHGANALGEW
ncbi:MFS transporter [Halobaculum lipolyticum]|uniref:MFS transporter n=1 Tax=Halobaculum lipolyticum TaxID=3032001 RepID=A0ABD5WAJ6_9EURY|nr:MFS transporter [Halobaculum sp. DT31]